MRKDRQIIRQSLLRCLGTDQTGINLGLCKTSWLEVVLKSGSSRNSCLMLVKLRSVSVTSPRCCALLTTVYFEQVENSLANSEREKELLHEHLHNLKPIVTPERPDSGWNEGVSVPDRTRHTLTKEKLAQHQARSSPVRRSVIPSSVSACENCGDTPPETFMCGRCALVTYCIRSLAVISSSLHRHC